MQELVKYSVREGVAILQVANPPLNALSRAVRQALLDAFARAAADQEVRAVVLAGEGRTFPAGADIREFDEPSQEPHLPDLCNAIETFSKPVVACLHGTVLGGGYEIALASHSRIAAPGTRVGFPEVGLGVLPAAGGTQRLPRIVSVETALDMMLSGKPVSVSEKPGSGLVDGLVDGDLVSAGVAHARHVISTSPLPLSTRNRRDRFSEPFDYQSAIDAARNALEGGNVQAQRAIIDCIEAAPLLPFDQGLALERDIFIELRDTDTAKALRHVYLAIREAEKPRPGLPEPRAIKRVGIVGGGHMGSGIVVSCLDSGHQVTLLDQPIELVRAHGRVKGTYDRAIKRGRLSEDSKDERLSRLHVTAEYSDLAMTDLVIEAVPDDPDLKAAVLKQVVEATELGTIVATNTSYLDIDDLAEEAGRAIDVVGLHFFSPAHVQQVVEVVIGTMTDPQVEATAFAFVHALRKKPVRSENSEGFIGNRILSAYRRAADFLMEDGASPYDIDAAMRDFGFKMGPYQTADLSGLDISWARRKRQEAYRNPDERYVRIADALCEAGRLGQKVGRGYYRYDEDSPKGARDEEVLALISAERTAKGIEARKVSPDEIQYSCLLAMMNEGGRLLDEGVAERAGDIDVIMLLGFGFPREKGGPMKASELQGLLPMLRSLNKLAETDPFWEPSEALSDAVKGGNRFSEVL